MKRWQVWLGLLISATLLFFALRGLDFDEIFNTLQSAEIIWALPGIPVYLFGVWLRAIRWKIFLNPIKTIRSKKLFPFIAIGYMGNNIYPARLGELVRAALLKKEKNIPVSATIATIIIERIFDGVVMIGFILLNLSIVSELFQNREIEQTIGRVATGGSGLFLFALLVLLTSAFYPHKSSNFFKIVVGKILPKNIAQKTSDVIDLFFTGIQSLASPLDTMLALILSVVIWLIETVFYWIIMQAFPFSISFRALMMMNGFINLFTIIPSSPGYIGTFDAPGIALLTALGIENQLAASYTLFLHAALWLPITVLGALFFTQKGLSWNETVKQAREGTTK